VAGIRSSISVSSSHLYLFLLNDLFLWVLSGVFVPYLVTVEGNNNSVVSRLQNFKEIVELFQKIACVCSLHVHMYAARKHT
jgi:hypothetical protein